MTSTKASAQCQPVPRGGEGREEPALQPGHILPSAHLKAQRGPRPRGDAPEGGSEVRSCPLTPRSGGVRPSEPSRTSFPNTAGKRRRTRFVSHKNAASANPADELTSAHRWSPSRLVLVSPCRGSGTHGNEGPAVAGRVSTLCARLWCTETRSYRRSVSGA